jgi:hypothetical protein
VAAQASRGGRRALERGGSDPEILAWSELVTLSGQQPPQDYEFTYTKDLLREMARVMGNATAQVNLVAFDGEDEAFAAFERARIESLKSQLGILG